MFRAPKTSFALALVLLLVLTSVALAQGTATVQTAQNPTLGNILVDGKGMALYIYTKDTAGVSNCTAGCLQAWPPLTVAQGETPSAGNGVTARLGTITRPEGTLQVTVNDLPVYYWAKDTAAGDVTGQGVNSVWYVLDPAGNQVTTALPAAQATTAPATAAATTAPAAATAVPADAAAAPTAAPVAQPSSLPTTGGTATDFLLPVLAFAAIIVVAGLGLNLARRPR